MISAAHFILYSNDAEADREFFKDVLAFSSVDAGHGWLIFALPPSEAAIHPIEGPESHELFLMCTDLPAEIASLRAKGVVCSPVKRERWGTITRLSLPGGGSIGVYQPKHKTAVSLAG